jgi:hypothetical protein
MITILSTLASLLSFRVRSRASLELELIALRHQVIVLRRQRPRRLQLFFTDLKGAKMSSVMSRAYRRDAIHRERFQR